MNNFINNNRKKDYQNIFCENKIFKHKSIWYTDVKIKPFQMVNYIHSKIN